MKKGANLASSEGIERLQRCSGDSGAPETPPHNLGREVVRHFLEREEGTADGLDKTSEEGGESR